MMGRRVGAGTSGCDLGSRVVPRPTCIAAVVLLAAVPRTALAQQAENLREDPSRIERSLEERERTRRLKARDEASIPQVTQPGAPAPRAPVFVLSAVSLTGNTVMPTAQLADAWQPFLGTKVSEADLQTIAAEITETYRDAGYPLTRAVLPPQDVTGGAIVIDVIEGHVAEVAFSEPEAESFGAGRYASAIVAERPLTMKTLERQLLLINDTPGLSITDSTFEELGSLSGRFRLTVHVETWKVWARAAMDNRGISEVGPLQATVSAAINSLFGGGETVSLDLLTVPDSPDELGSAFLAIDVPLGATGARLGVSAAASEVRPDDERRDVDTVISSESVALHASVAAYRSRTFSLWLRAEAAMRDARERSDNGTAYRDRLRTATVSADTRVQDPIGGDTSLSLGLRQGLDIFGASSRGDSRLSRSDGRGEFTKATALVLREQRITDDLSLVLSGAAQWASTSLLAAEEFYVGGPAFGRGYDGGELSGEYGLAGAAELRFERETGFDWPQSYRLYAFYDAGIVWNRRPGRDRSVSLESAGGGMVLYLPYGVELGGEVAVPLTYRSSANNDRDARFFFGLSKEFKLN